MAAPPERRIALIPVDHDPFRVLEEGEPALPRAAPRRAPAERSQPSPSGAYKDKTVCVIDNGLFVELAVNLVKDFGRVLYYAPWEFTFPTTNRKLLGDGIPGVHRIDAFWPLVDEIDLFIFPWVNDGPLQVYLASIGKRVWGSKMGEALELDREGSKAHMRSVGIDIGKYKLVTGVDALREHLKEHEDQYVKISRCRGDFDSFHAKNYNLIEPLIDDLEHRFGARKGLIRFVVEEGIPDAIEIGCDVWTVDGKYPESGTRGIEVKDRGFVMRSGPYADIPESIRDINTKLVPAFEHFQYRGFFSTEARVTKGGKAYVIDLTCRAPSPPSQLYWIMISNWADIFWEGAGGTVVEPEFEGKWGAELILTSNWAEENWQPIEFPKRLRHHVRISNLSIIDGKHYFVPQDGNEMSEIGAVVALGETMDDAIKTVRKIADEVEGHCINTNSSALDAAKDQIKKLKEFGIEL